MGLRSQLITGRKILGGWPSTEVRLRLKSSLSRSRQVIGLTKGDPTCARIGPGTDAKTNHLSAQGANNSRRRPRGSKNSQPVGPVGVFCDCPRPGPLTRAGGTAGPLGRTTAPFGPVNHKPHIQPARWPARCVDRAATTDGRPNRPAMPRVRFIGPGTQGTNGRPVGKTIWGRGCFQVLLRELPNLHPVS